jgi:23S rRNA pseudouridine1911/1915/1917 synthase
VRPGLVHRLDRETSGLIVVAKNARAHRILCRQFQRKNVEKLYVALVDGEVLADTGEIEGNIGRHADQKIWGLKEEGKPSLTRFRVLRRESDSTLLELEPVTGRTNQLRIHCASIGHPIVGDANRGGRPNSRLCLHAARLGFREPTSGNPVSFSSEADFSEPTLAREAVHPT